MEKKKTESLGQAFFLDFVILNKDSLIKSLYGESSERSQGLQFADFQNLAIASCFLLFLVRIAIMPTLDDLWHSKDFFLPMV